MAQVSVSVPVGFVEDKVSLLQVTVRVILFTPVNIIPPSLHTRLHVHFFVTGRTSGRNLRALNLFSVIGQVCVRKCCNCVVVCNVVGILELHIYIYVLEINTYEEASN